MRRYHKFWERFANLPTELMLMILQFVPDHAVFKRKYKKVLIRASDVSFETFHTVPEIMVHMGNNLIFLQKFNFEYY